MIWSNIYKEISERIMNMRLLLENLEDLSPELVAELAAVPDVEYIDLWHEQTDHLDEEHPFPTPAVFIAFNTLDTEDNGVLVQDMKLQLDLYVFWETFSDTYDGAVMQEEALNYLNLLTVLNVLFHGYTSDNFSTLRKTGFQRMDSGGAGNLYRVSFECPVRDYSAQELHGIADMADRDITVSDGPIPERMENGENLYEL